MKRIYKILLAFFAIALLLCLIFLPKWGEGPAQLALGEWRTQSKTIGLHAEVTEGQAKWYGRAQGNCTYQWIQTDREPYRLRLTRGNDSIEADVTFDGPDTAILELDILAKLPEIARERLRKQNKLNNRPENEFRFIFARVKPEKE